MERQRCRKKLTIFIASINKVKIDKTDKEKCNNSNKVLIFLKNM